jgi:hypothetical protein
MAAAHCPLTARLANRTEKKFHLGIFLFFSTSFSKQLLPASSSPFDLVINLSSNYRLLLFSYSLIPHLAKKVPSWHFSFLLYIVFKTAPW